MAITKKSAIDQITVTENGVVLFREATTIEEDGKLLSQTFHRSSVMPGQDIENLPSCVQSVCTAAWTPDNIAAWSAEFVELQAAKRKQQLEALVSLEKTENELAAAHERAKIAAAERREELARLASDQAVALELEIRRRVAEALV